MILILSALLVWYLISKPKQTGVLYCGLFGGSFNRALNEDILKNLKLLGLFNQQRGEDSCGYYNGKDLVKGVDANKKFLDFTLNGHVKLPDEDSTVFIGHVRKATSGSHTKENAHPFDINDRMIFAHNGVISNAWPMCTEHEIDHKGIFVDSIGLGLLLDKVGTKILEKYKGFAALSYLKKDEPSTIYLFHGKSKEWSSDKEPSEERPLFYLTAEEGIYYSSLRTALMWINGGDDKEKIKTVPYNRIIKLKNGKFKETDIVINRESANLAYTEYPVSNSCDVPVRVRDNKTVGFQVGMEKIEGLDIMNETVPYDEGNVKENRILWWKGRYHLSDGLKLADGVLRINKKREILKADDYSHARTATCYFYQGIMLKGENEYRSLKDNLGGETSISKLLKSDKEDYIKQYLSKISKYPITAFGDECINAIARKAWWINEQWADGQCIKPVFSDRMYHFRKGRLVKITGEDRDRPFMLESRKDTVSANANPLALLEQGRLEFDKKKDFTTLPEELQKYVAPFRKVFDSYEDAISELEGIPYMALEEYAEDLIYYVLNQEIDAGLVERIITELVLSAHYGMKTIEEMLDPQLNDIESYVFDAYQQEQDELEAELSNEDVKENFHTKEDDDDSPFIPDDMDTNGTEPVIINHDRADLPKRRSEILNEIQVANAAFEDALKKESKLAALNKLEKDGKVISLFKDDGYKSLLSYDVNDEETKQSEEQEACDHLLDIVHQFKEYTRIADELQTLNSSDFAQDLSKATYLATDMFRNELMNICSKFSKSQLIAEIKKSYSIH